MSVGSYGIVRVRWPHLWAHENAKAFHDKCENAKHQILMN
jgi:hypothetical protein